jgi:hypothetical protein
MEVAVSFDARPLAVQLASGKKAFSSAVRKTYSSKTLRNRKMFKFL